MLPLRAAGGLRTLGTSAAVIIALHSYGSCRVNDAQIAFAQISLRCGTWSGEENPAAASARLAVIRNREFVEPGEKRRSVCFGYIKPESAAGIDRFPVPFQRIHEAGGTLNSGLRSAACKPAGRIIKIEISNEIISCIHRRHLHRVFLTVTEPIHRQGH
ncbi:hypothetical protein D3C81_549570 [compost metagenome]